MVGGGLLCLTAAYAWVSTSTATTGYGSIVGQMVLLGSGMGLTSTPATEAIMGVVPAAKAGIGSAVNDATRELGGTLGVAIIGSVSLSLYRDAIGGAGLPAEATAQAQESVGAAYAVAGSLPGSGGERLTSIAQSGFLDGLSAGCLVASGVTFAAALLVFRYLPAHPVVPVDVRAREAPPAGMVASA